MKTATRLFSSLFLLLSLCVIAACGGSNSGGASSDPNAPKTIVLWHNWQGAYLDAKKAIFDEYHKQHPNVTIKLVQQADLVNKATTAVKQKNGPDMIAWADDALGQLAASRVVIPMDQYISADFLKSTYSAPAAQAVTYNGKVYGVPETVEAVTMMYNKKLLKENDVPKTTDELLNFAKEYQAKHPGQFGVVWNTTDAYFDAPWFYGFGGYYVKEDGTVGLTSEGSLKATEYLASFRQYMPKQISYDVASSLFTEGKSAIIINGPWSYSDYKKVGIDVGFAKLPTIGATNTPAKPFVGVKSLWVTSNAKDPALCADIMKFYTNTENQVKMSKQSSEIPANSAAAQDTSVKENPAINGYVAQIENGIPLPNTPYMSALWKPVQDAMTAVWSGKQSPADAMKAAQKAAESGVQNIKG
uniref:ABC transporter substrate-binding protein n=1 Tax=Thermosporothrix sp. COM3 TaxID=2490863 RepID=A0A455SR81_9CHLR|nr:ABC transporter substrate-binding protein [Thermosporothrix sp. COM3]